MPTLRIRALATTPSSRNWATIAFLPNGRSTLSTTPRKEQHPAHLLHGKTLQTLTRHSRDMAMLQTLLQKRKKHTSSTPTTLALLRTSPTRTATSPNMMPTCHTVNSWLTSTLLLKKCHTSSTARSSTRRRACTTMGQDI